jgi:8-amino-7-oxononanoate synthase
MNLIRRSTQFASKTIEETLGEMLEKRKAEGLYRTLQWNPGLVDFCSNDYLSFARSEKIRKRAHQLIVRMPQLSGATGSRSISGNTAFAEDLEKFIAEFHGAEAGLLFNSGYDANVGLFSCIAGKDDLILCDELVHASIIDGSRLSRAIRYKCDHNDVNKLEKTLGHARENPNATKNIFVVVESVYSMDGDVAPLQRIAALCKEYSANLIVDEAHATGIFGKQGRGLVCELGLEDQVFARIHTFGKAIGCHGAIVTGSEVLRNYLINFARSFIFTTALPVHSLALIRAAYEELLTEGFDNADLRQLIKLFKGGIGEVMNNNASGAYLIESNSPVQSIVVPGQSRVREISQALQASGLDVRAILSPSVPKGKERLRISLHLHNTIGEINKLTRVLKEVLKEVL